RLASRETFAIRLENSGSLESNSPLHWQSQCLHATRQESSAKYWDGQSELACRPGLSRQRTFAVPCKSIHCRPPDRGQSDEHPPLVPARRSKIPSQLFLLRLLARSFP